MRRALLLVLVAVMAAAEDAGAAVTWHPWGDAAFAQAKRENKPVFLSIGYSTCHWCHVMERESFSDPEIAKLMDEAFVSIKVDREERPDIDAVYITVTRTLTGDAGWPNNVILTPEGKPFFAGSYIPKEKFRALIPRVSKMWAEQREQVASTAAMVTASLNASATAVSSPDAHPDLAPLLTRGYEQLAARFDRENGGFLPEPKFPSAHHLMFLLRYWRRSGEPRALEMVETTLAAMRAGAIRDAKGFGFHRYTSDAKWAEPHYEKMLYDQAMLAMVYLEAYQATKKEVYARTAREIFTYVLGDLTLPNGAFAAAQDADEAYYTAPDRSKLKPPARDEKVLADWNGLMIAALANGSVVLDEPKYAAAATRAAEAVTPRRRKFLDDHAFLVWGLLNLYEATFDERWLQSAIELEDETLRLFRDDAGRFYITPRDAEALLVRPREVGDGSIPSGNSVQLLNLIRLGRITTAPKYDQAANAVLRTAFDDISLAPSASPQLLSGIDFLLGPSLEIVLAGKDVRPMQRAVFAPFAPNKIVLHATSKIAAIAPFTEAQKPLRGKPTAYVCTNYLCRLPVTEVGKVGELMGR